MEKRNLLKAKSLISLSLSFFLVAYGQPAWIPFLAPLAAAGGYALFWKGIQEQRRTFLCSLVWYALVQAVQLSWMTSFEYQGYYILVVYFALCLTLGALWGVFTCFGVNNQPFSCLRIGMLASVWTLLEWIRLHILCGFSWNPAGMALASYPLSMQLAAFLGVYGLSFWVMFTNLVILHRRLLLWVGCALFPYLLGVLYWGFYAKVSSGQPYSIALVQTALLPSQKNLLQGRSSEYMTPSKQWKRIFSLLEKIERSPLDLMVFPEAALPHLADIPIYMAEDLPSFPERVSHAFLAEMLARKFHAEVVIGLDARMRGKNYNAAFHFTPEGAQSRYDKRVLLPLAEYLPFAWLKPFVQSYGIEEFFTHGKEAVIFRGKVPLSASICYEETFGNLMREGRKKGAMLFVNLTNDQWYPFSRLTRQHLHHAKLRAVENGLFHVRASNGGTSAIIDPFGNIIAQLGDEEDVLYRTISLHSHSTLYTLIGDTGIVCICVTLILFYCYFFRLAQKNRVRYALTKLL